MFIIPDLLSSEQCRNIRELLVNAQFLDGKQTAGPGSSRVKNNLQGSPADPAIQQVQMLVHERLVAHPQYRILAVPRIVRPMTVNRYDVGMYYGDHLDHPLLAGEPPARGDISTTVFLSSPEEYEGGELVINSIHGEPVSIKLPAGQAVCYPAGTLHRVNPVTKGSRLAAVTVAESRIQDDTRRELFSDVSQLTRWVQDIAAGSPQERLANKIYNKLMRMWCQP
ncbi:MAG: Fe2+-dependent dioxygenase [Xanthomonadales bacterium]|nr:Fe2+-dependent dioxygenase [Xanthomonadales bacterium]